MIHETPDRLAAEFASRLPCRPEPDCIVDLGCGRGILLEATLAKFPGTTALGIEIQKQALKQARAKVGDRARFFHGDATHHGFVKRTIERSGITKKDRIVFISNPPFGRNPAWKPTGRARGLDSRLQSIRTDAIRSRYPYQFLVTQLSLARQTGLVSNIVPRSVVVGDAWSGLRTFCEGEFEVVQSAQVGYHRFSGREVGVGILTLQPSERKSKAGQTSRCDARSLGDLSSNIVRGGPVKRSKYARRRILHSSSLGGIVVEPVARKFTRASVLPQGDVIAFLRVARAAGRVVHVRTQDRELPFSDCLAVLRVSLGHGAPLSLVYWSDQYRSEDSVPHRGTGARYLTRTDIKSLPLPEKYDRWHETLDRVYRKHVDKLDAGSVNEFFASVGKDLARHRVRLTFTRAEMLARTWERRP